MARSDKRFLYDTTHFLPPTPMVQRFRGKIGSLIGGTQEKRLSIFRSIPVNQQGWVLLRLPFHTQHDVLQGLRSEEISAFIETLDPDEVTDILQRVDRDRRATLKENLSKDLRHKVEFLLRFNPSSAAGLMDLNFVIVERSASFETVGKALEKHEEDTGKFPTILVAEKGTLVGDLPGYAPVLHQKNVRISRFVRAIPTIRYNEDQEQVIDVFRRYPRNKIVVLDEESNIIGVIHSDEILKLLDKESTQDLYDFAGLRDEETVNDRPLVKVRYRYSWLVINLATAFIAAAVVGLFQETISHAVLLAAYMPIVAGMGGNAATQTLAVVVRGLALREIDPHTGSRVIMREALAGLMNGLIIGGIIAAISVAFSETPLIGLIAAVSIVINLVIAGTFGALVPMLMKKLGRDPASSATIFITTATDVCGFFTFLGLATLVL